MPGGIWSIFDFPAPEIFSGAREYSIGQTWILDLASESALHREKPVTLVLTSLGADLVTELIRVLDLEGTSNVASKPTAEEK